MQIENILELKNVTKLYPGVKALDSVDFSVKKGEVHCLIGANGAGKSTLVKIITGDVIPESGTVYFEGKKIDYHGVDKRRNKEIAAIYQELSLLDGLSIAENVFLNNYPRTKFGLIDWDKVYEKTAELEKKINLGLNPKTEVGKISAGHRQLTEIMKALAQNAKLIIMDEPSSTLSENEFEELRKVIEDLKSHGITVIYISHHLEELFIVGDRVTVLRNGKYVATEELANINQEQLVSLMTGYHMENTAGKTGKHNIYEENVLELRHISNKKVKDMNLTLHKGEILGMYGLVGSGRTETMASVFGIDPHTEGQILLNGREFRPKGIYDAIQNGIGMVPENRLVQGMVPGLAISENMIMASLKKFVRYGFLDDGKIIEASELYKKKLSIKASSVREKIGMLSGGNQQKVIMAKWLLTESNILIIDEPTQGIDVMTKQDISRIIIDSTAEGKSVIVISSELRELMAICDRILIMYDGREVETVPADEFDIQRIMNAAITGRAENEKQH